LRFFEYLKDRGALFDDFQGKKTLSVFFLDKDVDDLTGRIMDSPHILYTEHYEHENYLFRHGDVVTGAATAAAIDPAVIRQTLGDVPRWRRGCADLWRDWVTLCVYSQIYNVTSIPNYGVRSRVNTDCFGDIDAALLEGHRRDLSQASGISEVDFELRLAVITTRVNDLYRQNKHDSVFKGKWYASFLENRVRTAAGVGGYDQNGFEGRLLAAVSATLDIGDPWADRFRKYIEQLLDRYHIAGAARTAPMRWLVLMRGWFEKLARGLRGS
jgi:hypothetical protein